jgi:phenylacetate-CoA ligase
LYERYAHEFSSLCRAPFLPRDEIEARQVQRIGELLEIACDIPLYRDAFFNVGAAPYHFTSLTDLARFPIITKRMFIEAGPYRCIRHTTFPYTYPTRSSGSSGLVLMLGFDPNAVISDTLQGARQLILQSDGRLSPRELTMHYYTQPWYTGHINGDWRSGFISSLIAPQRAADFLRDARPTAFGSYPSLVQALIPHIAPGDFHVPSAIRSPLISVAPFLMSTQAKS